MHGRTENARQTTVNPLDLLEEIVSGHNWAFDRLTDDELACQVDGKWGGYRLHFAWAPDMSALQFICGLEVRIPNHKRGPVNELLALANSKIWLGHLDLAAGEEMPTFRHTVPLRGVRGASVEQLEDLIDAGISECDRYYPAFQYVVWGGKAPSEAIAAAVLETRGQA
jgi:hypothetical protein